MSTYETEESMMVLEDWTKVANGSRQSGTENEKGLSPRTAEGIFLAYSSRVYNIVRRMLGNDSDAEDVTQEVFLQVVRKLDSFRGEAHLTTWLYRVSVNAVLLQRRKQRRRRENLTGDCSLDAVASGKRPGDGTSAYPAPDQQMLHEEMRDMIEAAISRLPAIYRDVFVLADVEGFSNPEISRLLHLGVPAVKSRLHRARLMMRETLPPALLDYLRS
jgi:RNA polymerase sigma-70 factor, ECF subfamily